MCPPGLHITLGIFYRLFSLLEDECHQLDLKVVWEEDCAPDGGVSFGHHLAAIEHQKQIENDIERLRHSKKQHKIMMFVPCRLQIEMNYQQDLITAILCMSDDPEEDEQLWELIKELQKQTQRQQRLVCPVYTIRQQICSAYLDIHVERGKRKGEEGF